MNAIVMFDETPVGECAKDPERWTTTADDEAKTICRACPRRWLCAREAVELPRAEGLWAGIVVPEGGRGRTFALRQLRSLAERNGYPVRATRRVFPDTAA
jgi:WhiB family redox-sensing transcriptional regulator